MFPVEKLIVPVNSGPVPILSAYATVARSITTLDIVDNTLQLSDPSVTLFPGAKLVFILPNTEKVVSCERYKSVYTFLSMYPYGLKTVRRCLYPEWSILSL